MNIEPEVVACMNDMLDIVVKKEQKRLYEKQRYQKRKEKIKQKNKEYYHKNKDKLTVKKAEYYQKNRCKILEYYQTLEGIKSHRICNWRKRGVICDNWDALYDHYSKTSYCDFCRVQLSTSKERCATTKVLDHDHSITDRPNFRNILCNSCNVQRK